MKIETSHDKEAINVSFVSHIASIGVKYSRFFLFRFVGYNPVKYRKIKGNKRDRSKEVREDSRGL